MASDPSSRAAARAPAQPAAPGDPKRHIVFALLASAMLIFNMQCGMVAVALGRMTADLHAPLQWSGWVLTMFLLGMVISLPVAGRLAERFGARTVFVVGLFVFTVASVVCAVSPTGFRKPIAFGHDPTVRGPARVVSPRS